MASKFQTVGFRTVLMLATLVLALQVFRTHDFKTFSLSDFGEYWAAGRLLLAHRNPYSAPALLALQSSVGFTQPDAIMMWNPPWALTIVLPFASLPYEMASFLWLTVNTIVIFFAANCLWRVFSHSRAGYVPLMLAATFVPGLINLRAGHLTAFVLLGIAGFICFQRLERFFLSGACVALLLLKPHLLWLILLLLGWDIVRYRRSKVLLGVATGTAILLAIPLILQPAVLEDYLAAIRSFPMLASYAPNFGGLLRMSIGERYHWLQFAPCLPGLGFLAYSLVRHYEENWERHLPLLALISFLTSPYGWTYDEIVLLPAFLQIAGHMRERPTWWRWTALGIYLAANAAVLLVMFWWPHDASLRWTSPLWLLLYCLGLLATQPQPVTSPVASFA